MRTFQPELPPTVRFAVKSYSEYYSTRRAAQLWCPQICVCGQSGGCRPRPRPLCASHSHSFARHAFLWNSSRMHINIMRVSSDVGRVRATGPTPTFDVPHNNLLLLLPHLRSQLPAAQDCCPVLSRGYSSDARRFCTLMHVREPRHTHTRTHNCSQKHLVHMQTPRKHTTII